MARILTHDEPDRVDPRDGSTSAQEDEGIGLTKGLPGYDIQAEGECREVGER